ncbi:MAG: efflux RND transporter periplasmic adaptor subunit [Victivallales bacterium]|nr:efflux RND transporter periplasmic adaptor subunit [Victivallales bacterium]
MSEPDAKPKAFTGELRRDVKIFPGETDAWGHVCWTLFDPVSDRYFKISDLDYRVLSLFDRNYEITEFLDKLQVNGVRIGEMELWQMLGFLRVNGLLQAEYGETETRMERTRAFKKTLFWQIILNSYLFIRIPLLKPDRFLNRSLDVVTILVNRWVIMLLAMIALGGYISLVPNWNMLAGELFRSISLKGLLRYSLAIIVIKCVHEFAHAYTAKAYGIRVRRMGIVFIVFFPRLYTDLTDAWRINDRRKRFMMDAAGIIAEILIGGLAAVVWVNTGPGSAHTIAYYILTVSAINTLLVNGNPFIRYDGYYMLMDVVNIDNLQKRGADRIRALFRKYTFGLQMPVEKFAEPWKNGFLVFFGIAGFIYRIFLYTSIILVVYFQFTKTIGIILLCLEFYLLILKPFITEGKAIMAARKNFNRKNLIAAYCLLGIILLPLIVPLPWKISSPCEIRSAESAVIYNQNDGYIQAIKVTDGATVEQDDALFVLDSPRVGWQLQQAQLDRRSLKEELDQLRSDSETIGPTHVKIQQLKASENLIEELQRRRQLLTLKSPIGGQIVFYDDELQTGKFLMRGAPIAEVFNPKRIKVIALVKEEDIEYIAPGDRVSIGMEKALGTIRGRVEKINPVPLRFVPPLPSLDAFGGALPVRRDGNQLELLIPCYQVIITPDRDPGWLTVGRSGQVWFHKYTSIGWKLISKAANVLLRELNF